MLLLQLPFFLSYPNLAKYPYKRITIVKFNFDLIVLIMFSKQKSNDRLIFEIKQQFY